MTPPPEAVGERELQVRLRQAEREKSLLVAALVLVLALAVLQRAGSRVVAVAVYDKQSKAFVEQVYLAQRAQAEQALALVRQRARAAHPYYGDKAAGDLFERAANAGFQEPLQLPRVRRLTPLHQASGAADAPVQAAADLLEKVVRVVVDAHGIWDANAKRFVAVLPSQALAQQALDTRLENVAAQVKQDLRAPDHLRGKPAYLQSIELRPARRWPLSQVLTVQQAVDYLAKGDPREAEHEVQTGESARNIADKYGARLTDLAAWNPGRDLTRLRVGDKLIVRRPEAPLTVVTVESRTYREGGKVVTLEVRRHNGVETSRAEVERRSAR